MSNTADIMRNLVPKKCKMVDGRLKGGFTDWDSEEGKAINEALLIMAKYQEIKELLEPLRTYDTHNEYLEELKTIVR